MAKNTKSEDNVQDFAQAASESLTTLPFESVRSIGCWIQAYVQTLGHRRLGRVLLNHYDGERVEPAKLKLPKDKTPALESAVAELGRIPREDVDRITAWWETWYPVAGHKNLAVLLTSYQSVGALRQPKAQAGTSGGSAKLITSLGEFVFSSGYLDSSALFTSKCIGGTTEIKINSSHPLFPLLMEAIFPETLKTTTDKGRLKAAERALKLLIAAWVQYEQELPGKRNEDAALARQDWGRVARRMAREESDDV